MKPAALMLQGTGSDVGKSLLTAGLARAFTRRGLAVRPFKPQNMSNNAAVTADGGEIGRAQALQARACGVEPSVHMNPVLLKPQTDLGAQVVVQGKVYGNAAARDYQALKAELLPAVLDSFARLSADADLVLVEGAGSAAEVNLRSGDIDRGGVIAAIVGTWTLLPAAERARLAGVIINRFRGDVSLFDEGLAVIERETGLACFGVVPYFAEAPALPAEDALGVEGTPAPGARNAENGAIKVAVPVLSRIANFDDLDPLMAEPDVTVDFVAAGTALPGDADLVVLPGSKATLADLAFLRAQGWDIDIAAHLRRGGQVLGLCGGYQMLGQTVRDPGGVEGAPGEAEGLGLLEVETELGGDKTLSEAEGVELASGAAVRGYEMHIGATRGPDLARPMLELSGRPEGAISADGRVMGCYLHGLFAADGFRSAFLSRLRDRATSGVAYEAGIERTLDNLAEHLEAHLDLDALLEAARRRG